MSKLKEKAPYVIEQYNSSKTIQEISKLSSLSICSIYKILNTNNIKLNRKEKYSINESYFTKIDSNEKAYILGFILADGYNNVERYNLRITLHRKDIDILEKIKLAMCANNNISLTSYNNSTQATLSIINKKISSDLFNLGMKPGKSYNAKLPVISENLYKSLILGIFDGDGSLSINHNEYDRGSFTITGTKEMIFSISNIFRKECDVNCYINQRYKERDNNNYSLNLCGNKVVIRVLNWLYTDSTIYLNRKHDKYLKLKEIINMKMKIKEDKKIKIDTTNSKNEIDKIEIETKIISLYKENKSIRQINLILNLDRRFISKIIKKYELPIKDKSNYNDYKLIKIKEYYFVV